MAFFFMDVSSGGWRSDSAAGDMDKRITLSRSDGRELLTLLTRGAEIIYGSSTSTRELNVARRMRLLRRKIERKLL